MTTKMSKYAETALERNVARWIDRSAAEYENGAEGVISDLMHGGCQSGIVGHLIYYVDTLAYYRKHREEIDALLCEQLRDVGYENPSQMFGGKWDNDDPFAREVNNRNLLAWFGFEETAFRLGHKAGFEI